MLLTESNRKHLTIVKCKRSHENDDNKPVKDWPALYRNHGIIYSDSLSDIQAYAKSVSDKWIEALRINNTRQIDDVHDWTKR
jgi:hypothetical protein